jgi:glutamate/tyrosine decarboxylase-like PLP-dependent enzyme|eukprot:evm.model.NODE_9838_length_19339_cov_67.359581.1
MLIVIDGVLHTVIVDSADIDEYPQTYEIQKRCVNMLSRLWHAPLEPEEGKEGGQEGKARGR